MKIAKEYAFKSSGLIFEVIILIITVAPIILLLVYLFSNPVQMLLIGAVPGLFLYFQFYVVCIIIQFNKFDKGKKVVISDDRTKLTLIQDENITEISNKDVEKVEIYDQKDLGRFGQFNYIVIYTVDQKKLLITQFTVPRLIYDNILQSFLRKNREYILKGESIISTRNYSIKQPNKDRFSRNF